DVPPSVSADGTLRCTPAPDAVGSADLTLVLSDDGGTADGGVDTSDPHHFTITVTPVNDAPAFSVSVHGVYLAEDEGPQTWEGFAVDISAGPADEAGQALSFIVTAADPSLFAQGPSISADGTLTFTTAPDAWGESELSIVLKDDGGTAHGGSDSSAPRIVPV